MSRQDAILQRVDEEALRARARDGVRRAGLNYREALAHSLNPQPTISPTDTESFGEVARSWLNMNVLFGKYVADQDLLTAERLVSKAGREQGYDPMEDPFVLNHEESTHYLFGESMSRAESMLISRRMAARERDLHILGNNPGKAVLAGFATLPFDPTLYIDILLTRGAASVSKLRKTNKAIQQIRQARAAYLRSRRARPVLTTAAGFGALGATVEGASELGLRMQDPQRTAAESAMNVALAGLFTAGFGALGAKYTVARRAKILEAMHKDKLVGKMVDDYAAEAAKRNLTPESPTSAYAEALEFVIRKNMPEAADIHIRKMSEALLGTISPVIRMSASPEVAERIFAMVVSNVPIPRAGVPDALIGAPLDSLTSTWKAKARDTWDEISLTLKGTGYSRSAKNRVLSDLVRQGGKFEDTSSIPVATRQAFEKAAALVKKFTDEVDDLMKKVGATEDLLNVQRLVDEGYFRRVWLSDIVKANEDALKEGMREYARQKGRSVDEEGITAAFNSISSDTNSSGMIALQQAREKGRSIEQAIELPSTFEWEFGGVTWKTSDFLDNNVQGMLEKLSSGLLPRLLFAEKFLTSQHGLMDELVETVNRNLKRLEDAGELSLEDMHKWQTDIDTMRRQARDADIRTALAASPDQADEQMLADYVRRSSLIERAHDKLSRAEAVKREVDAEVEVGSTMVRGHDEAVAKSERTVVTKEINEAIDEEVETAIGRSRVGRKVTDREKRLERADKQLRDTRSDLRKAAREEKAMERDRVRFEDRIQRETEKLEAVQVDARARVARDELTALRERESRARIELANAEAAVKEARDVGGAGVGPGPGKTLLQRANERLKRARSERNRLARDATKQRAEIKRAGTASAKVVKQQRKIDELFIKRDKALVERNIRNRRVARTKKLIESRTTKRDALRSDLRALRQQLPKAAERRAMRSEIKMAVLAGRRASSRAQRMINDAIKGGSERLAAARSKIREGRLPKRALDKTRADLERLRTKQALVKDEVLGHRSRILGLKRVQNRAAKRARQLGRRSLPLSRIPKARRRLPTNPEKWREYLEKEMGQVSGAVKQARRHAFVDAEDFKLLRRSVKGNKAATKRMNQAALKLKGLPLITEDPSAGVAQAGTALKALTAFRGLGNVVISSFGDAVIGLLLNGFNAWTRGIVSMLSNPIDTLFRPRRNREEAIRLMHALELVEGHNRWEAYHGFAVGGGALVPGGEGRLGRAGRLIGKVARKALLLDWWNARVKAVAGFGAMSELGAISTRVAKGGRLTRAEAAKLRAFGLNEDAVKRIGDEFLRAGETENVLGVTQYYAKSQDWTDEVAKRDLQAYLFSVSQSAVVTPGALDLPPIFSSPIGSFLTQFRSFSVAATNRVAFASRRIAAEQGLGHYAAWHANMLIGSYSVGWLILKLKNELAERGDDPITPLDAMEQAGTLGWVGDLGLQVGTAALGLESAHASRQMRVSSLMPAIDTVGLLIRNVKTGGKLAVGETPTVGDAGAARRSMPAQGVWYIRLLVDIMLDSMMHGRAGDGERFEESFARYRLGLPERELVRDERVSF